MSFTAIFANLACTDLERSIEWYSQLFSRPPDARPMAGLAEWHFAGAGLQVHENAKKAGAGSLTLFVDDIEAERTQLVVLAPAPLEQADYTTICRLSDPDSNLVVLAQPRSA